MLRALFSAETLEDVWMRLLRAEEAADDAEAVGRVRLFHAAEVHARAFLVAHHALVCEVVHEAAEEEERTPAYGEGDPPLFVREFECRERVNGLGGKGQVGRSVRERVC